MKTSRKLTAYALAAFMLLGSGGMALAQTTPTSPGGGDTTATDSPGAGSTMNRAGGDDRDFDWGWLGLLGLIGLAGLMRRDRAHEHRHHPGMTATTR